jgi:hypothetical protein
LIWRWSGYGDGTEVSIEKWIVENSLENRFIILWENGVLVKIDTIKKAEIEHKPLGKNKIGG